MPEDTYTSLTNMGAAHCNRKGEIKFYANAKIYMNGDFSTPRKQGKRFVITNFTNVSGVVDEINERLGTEFEPDPLYNSVTANYHIYTYTEEEARAIMKLLPKGSFIEGPVVVSTHEYGYEDNGEPKIHLDLCRRDFYYVKPYNIKVM